MEYGKYIIIESRGCELAILFDSIISHDDFLESFNRSRIVSAGKFAVGAKPRQEDPNDIEVNVFGKSVTLNLSVRKGTDERLIKRVLRKEEY